MQAPDPWGSAYHDQPFDQTNPGSTGAVYAWSRWKFFTGTALSQLYTDMTAVENTNYLPVTGVMS